MQSVCTKPRIYLTYGSYLGTIYDLNCADVYVVVVAAVLVKWIIYDSSGRYIFNNNNKTIKVL